MSTKRIVLDTNVLISHALMANSATGKGASYLLEKHTILYSASTLAELAEVLYRKKFDRYVTQTERRVYLAKFVETATQIIVTQRITDCEDPKDDQFLELAVCGKADLIVSGDLHLLNMNPFRGLKVVRPNEIVFDR